MKIYDVIAYGSVVGSIGQKHNHTRQYLLLAHDRDECNKLAIESMYKEGFEHVLVHVNKESEYVRMV
jgi:hypothetical protein